MSSWRGRATSTTSPTRPADTGPRSSTGRPRPTPLPACDDPDLQTVEFNPQPTDLGEPPAAFDADIANLLSKARALPIISVPIIDRASAKDTADGRVEEVVNEILVALVTEAGDRRIAQWVWEAEAKRWEEEARVRREQAEREAAERKRVEELLSEAEAWRRADALRGFIKAVEDLALARKVNSDEGTALAQWLAWAHRRAEALDPVARTLGRLMGKSVQ
jgi:hypothetical protein